MANCKHSESVRDWAPLPVRLDMFHHETSGKGVDKFADFAR